MTSLIGMYFRQVRAPIIVNAKIMAAQAGLDISSRNGISTQRLEAHYLAGGNVMGVIQAIIAAQRADIDWTLTARRLSIWPVAMCSMPCVPA